MKIEYQRNMETSYLVIDPEEDIHPDQYLYAMISNNRIPGLIPFQIRYRDGRKLLYYDVTSHKSLSTIYGKEKLDSRQVLSVLENVCGQIETAGSYLLNPDYFLYDPDLIFFDMRTEKAELCYLPADRKPEEMSVRSLGEYLIRNLDHSDEKAVKAGYFFYQKVCEPNFSFPDIMAAVREMEKSGPRENPEKPESCPSEEKPEPYQAERKADESRETGNKDGHRVWPGIKNFVLRMIPIVLLLGFIFPGIRFGIIDLTAAGGLSFLIIGFYIAAYRFRTEQRKKKKHHRRRRYSAGEEEACRKREKIRKDILYQELYEPNISGTELLMKEPVPYELYLENEEGLPEIPVTEEGYTIGKWKEKVQYCLSNPTVSRIHAKVQKTDEGFSVTDLDSRNGTFLNGEKLEPYRPQPIHAGDRVSFAEVNYEVRSRGDEPTYLLENET